MGDKGNSGLTWWQILAAIDTHILFASNGRRTLVLRVNSVKQVEPRNNHERRLRKNIIICLWPLDQSAEGKGWGFIDMRDTDKLKYFVIIEFNNCFISQSLNSFFTEHSRKWSDLPFSCKNEPKKEKRMVCFMHEQNVICSQTQLDDIAHEQTSICRQLFAGHLVGSPLHQMIKLNIEHKHMWTQHTLLVVIK